MSMKALVVDSGAFIKGGGGGEFERSSDKVYTVQEVVSEIKDAITRQRLQVLPYDLQVREPSHESVKHVTSFAKQTGDYHVLSHADIKVIALTYQLECELSDGRGSHLRTQPIKQGKQSISLDVHHPPSGVIGMYYGPNYDASSTGVSSPVSPYVSSPEVVSLTVPSPVYPLPDPNDKESNEPHDDHDHVKCDDDKDDFDHTNDFDCDHSDSLYCDHSESLDHDHADNLHHHHPKSLDHGDPDQDCPDDLDHGDDDDDWITPDNLHKAREQMGGATTASAKSVTVGCLTTDFSIQNVLLQMGLHVLSLDGMLIKQLHHHKLYCKACCKTTGHAASKFCPNCGNKALIRVKAVTNDQGETRFTPLSIKQFSRRGLKFPLPKPSGGRHANNPITCPDQKLPNQRTVNMKKEKVDVFSPEYVARSSPFAFHDVNSRGAVGGFNKRHVDSRNPNVVKRRGKRK